MAQDRGARHVHIETIQTVTPAKISEPDRSRRISTAVPITGELLRTRHRVVAYYKDSKEKADTSAFTLVGFLKESLNIVLGEYPLFAGRLRKNDKSGEVDQIKFNDAGVRLVQAKAQMSMEEFMEMKGRDGREGVLAYWMDVDEKTPQFSPLFYVQVTNFEGNGYSICLSCSVLLADPVMMTELMRAWSQVHATIMRRKKSLGEVLPIFHLTKFKRPGVASHLSSRQLDSPIPSNTGNPTLLFNLHEGAAPLNALRGEVLKASGEEGATGWELYQIHWGKEETRVESVSWKKQVAEDESCISRKLKVASWDALKAEEAVFGEGDTAVHVSYHVESNGGVGVLMLPSPKQDGLCWIAVAVPTKI